MRKEIAYVDTSIIVAILLKEPDYKDHLEILDGYETIVSSNLLEAELFSTVKREKLAFDLAVNYLENISILFPTEKFQTYFQQILNISYLRGADLFHLATALWFAGEKRKDLTFISLDEKQYLVAKRLGFSVDY